ncbi:hypothetical protein GCM10009081_17060 [Brevundimonas nasdae]
MRGVVPTQFPVKAPRECHRALTKLVRMRISAAGLSSEISYGPWGAAMASHISVVLPSGAK